MASNINIQKKCEWCGKLFIAHKTSTRCCSHRCANLAYKEKTRQKRVCEFQTMVNHQIEKEDCIDKDFFTPSEAAKYIGISRATFYRYLETNLIKSVQLKYTAKPYQMIPMPVRVPVRYEIENYLYSFPYILYRITTIVIPPQIFINYLIIEVIPGILRFLAFHGSVAILVSHFIVQSVCHKIQYKFHVRQCAVICFCQHRP